MKQLISWLSFIFACILMNACDNKKQAVAYNINDPAILHNNLKRLTDLIIYDVFTPPVAARIYSYTSLAAYEAVKFSKPGSPSITARLNGFEPMPEPERGKEYNYLLAASKAFFTVAYKVTFSLDTLRKYESNLLEKFSDQLDPATFERSVLFGESIGRKILARAAVDNYPQTRGKPRFTGSRLPGKWRPTPPDYMDAVEPCWGDMKYLAMDSGSQFKLPPPPEFSKDTASLFFRNALDVYTIGKALTKEEKDIANYWDDNPFVIEHAGHLMFANKKITPGGHWMGIASIACKKIKADEVKTAGVLALTAVSLMDGFIACWQEKFRTQLIRPVSVINESVDADWVPYLQTPPFPEYPSGHSTISAAAATVLTKLLGDNFSFHDDSDKEYIGMEKDFNSFIQASNEASISRVYGGIHYRSGVEAGAQQGIYVGNYIINKIRFPENNDLPEK
jgi:hypothetical protein